MVSTVALTTSVVMSIFCDKGNASAAADACAGTGALVAAEAPAALGTALGTAAALACPAGAGPEAAEALAWGGPNIDG